jgi:branched-chain amino acid transport system ATP-binding protein
MMEDAAILRSSNLVAGYIPEVNILNGCDVVVNAGEFVGIIGPNGAGKSTLLKAVLGQCKVRSGTVTLMGQDITGRKAHELVPMGVGYVPQNKNVFPSLTVKENLEMGCFLKPSVFHDRFDYVVSLFPKLHNERERYQEERDKWSLWVVLSCSNQKSCFWTNHLLDCLRPSKMKYLCNAERSTQQVSPS